MSDTHIDRQVARLLGRLMKEHGQSLAVLHHEADVWRGELPFIDALLVSPNETATTDDTVTDLAASFADGGHWRASIPKRLARLRLIAQECVERSCRVARRGGYVARYRIIDRDGLIARRTLTAAVVRALDDVAAGSTVHGTESTLPNGAGGPTA